MGANQSQNRSAEEEERFWREAEEMERKEREEAEAARQRAEADRLRQEERKKRREEAEARRRKAKEPFIRPSGPPLALSNQTSRQCQRCDIVIPPGLSSSTVILSRDILGKVPIKYTIQLPRADDFDNDTELVAEYNFPMLDTDKYSAKTVEEALIVPYKCKYPDGKFPDVWINGIPAGVTNLQNFLAIQAKAGDEFLRNVKRVGNQGTLDEDSRVIMWNPSETNGAEGAVAINYKTHGALTKVFLKPTIPFSISYGTAIDIPKATRNKEKEEKKQREEAKKKKEEAKKKAEEDSKKAKK